MHMHIFVPGGEVVVGAVGGGGVVLVVVSWVSEVGGGVGICGVGEGDGGGVDHVGLVGYGG